MSGNTAIEWTDSTCLLCEQPAPFQVNSVVECLKWAWQGTFGPFINSSITFRAVAGDAGRNNIVGNGPPSLVDGRHVIPSGGYVPTIGAQPLELCKNCFLPYHWDRLDSTFTCVSMLLSFTSVVGFSSVTFPRLLVNVHTAYTPTHISHRQPIVTLATIGQSHQPLLLPLFLARCRCGTYIITVLADCLVSIPSRSVYAKSSDSLPVLTLVTPFLPSVDVRHVFLKREAKLLCGNLKYAYLASHFLTSLFLVVSIHSIIAENRRCVNVR